MNKVFHSNGKLLLTGEYVVLDGATALAIPTKYGQSLEIKSSENKNIHWKSFDKKDNVWFEEIFEYTDLQPLKPDNIYSKTLSTILKEARNLNPNFLSDNGGLQIKTKLDFPRNWGLGTSSTLINNIAEWAQVNAFLLLEKSFGGSGYDIAAAQHKLPILYQLKNGKPNIKEVHLPWQFKDSLFFVYLNQKQDSKKGIERYRNTNVSKSTIQQISNISNQLLSCTSLSEFKRLMNLHEEIISENINLPTVKSQLFNDYPHTIKSLGAWGGDFVLVIGTTSEMEYFRRKGFGTIISFKEMNQ